MLPVLNTVSLAQLLEQASNGQMCAFTLGTCGAVQAGIHKLHRPDGQQKRQCPSIAWCPVCGWKEP